MEECSFTKSNTHLSVFFTFFKFCKWYQIAQRITYAKTDKASFFMSIKRNLNLKVSSNSAKSEIEIFD